MNIASLFKFIRWYFMMPDRLINFRRDTDVDIFYPDFLKSLFQFFAVANVFFYEWQNLLPQAG